MKMEYNPKLQDPREEVFNYIVKNGWTLLEMSPKEVNLEYVFRKLTH